MNPQMLPKVRSRALLDAVKDYPCELRLMSFIGKSCAGPTTVVACHLPTLGKGTGTKVSDLFVAAGCSKCHDVVDMRNMAAWEAIQARFPVEYQRMLMQAMCATQARLLADEIISVKGGEII